MPLIIVLLIVGAGCASVPGSGPPADWYPLKRQLKASDLSGFRLSFRPAHSGDYAVTLRFDQPIEVEEVRRLVARAAASVGKDDVAFDFDWRVFEAENAIARGTGRRGATGTIDTGSEGLGGGALSSRALVFGKFSAQANRSYSFEFQAGPGLMPVVRVAPVLEIVFEPAFAR